MARALARGKTEKGYSSLKERKKETKACQQKPYPFHLLYIMTKTTGTNSLGCPIAPL